MAELSSPDTTAEEFTHQQQSTQRSEIASMLYTHSDSPAPDYLDPLPITWMIRGHADLMTACIREGHRYGGFRGNPFTPHIVPADNSIASAESFAAHASMLFLAFAGSLNTHNNGVIEFETIGVIGGTFNKVEFVGMLYTVRDWLQIEETYLPNKVHMDCGREYAMYRFRFSKKS